jgi:hypothetical protein
MAYYQPLNDNTLLLFTVWSDSSRVTAACSLVMGWEHSNLGTVTDASDDFLITFEWPRNHARSHTVVVDEDGSGGRELELPLEATA